MSRLDGNLINEIQSKSDIVDIISRYIPVINKGQSAKAVCPFHDDKNPSLNISRSKQIFTCFACKTSGNVFTFVSKIENIPYIESVKKVASLIGFDDPALKETITPFQKENQALYNALNDAASLYHSISKSKVGLKAQEYFKKREIDETMQDYFNLGYSPEDSNLSIEVLRGKNHSVINLDKVGITTRNGSNITDFFHGRIMFPITDEKNNTIGFSGRIIEGNDSKYVNSPATPLFNKSQVLYNLANAVNEARKVGYIYIVEGFMDVFSLYKAGIKSSIALMGTAFTINHANKLRKIGVELRLMLDGDAAGQLGIVKMIDILDEESLPYKVVDYKGIVLDPDEILIQHGKEKLLEISNNLISGTDFLIDYYLKKIDINSIDGKKKFLEVLAKRVYLFKTDFEKEEYGKKLARICSTSLKIIGEFARKNKEVPKEKTNNETNLKPVVTSKKKKEKKNRLIRLERELIFQMLYSKNAIEDFINTPNSRFFDDIYGLLFNYILDLYEKGVEVNISTLLNSLQNSEKVDEELINNVVLLSQEEHAPYSESLILDTINELNKTLKKQIHEESVENIKNLTIDEQKRSSIYESLIKSEKDRKEVKKYGKKEESN